ncbi:MAG: hypothetical protein V4649_05410 [Bacteroidota bacterium]
MRSIKYSVFAAAMVVTSFSTVKAQTADDIVQKHVTAIGGADNWKKVKSVKMTGSMNAGGNEMPITITIVHNTGFRMDLSIAGMNNYQILTKEGGWSYFPVGGQVKAEAMPAEAVKESQDQLDVMDALVDYKAKGRKVTLLGKDDVEGTECFKLKLTHENGKEETMFIDAATFHHIRSVEKMKANGKEVEATSNYGNYQKLPEGIMYPMSIETPEGPLVLKTVEINKPVDNSIFKPAN